MNNVWLFCHIVSLLLWMRNLKNAEKDCNWKKSFLVADITRADRDFQNAAHCTFRLSGVVGYGTCLSCLFISKPMKKHLQHPLVWMLRHSKVQTYRPCSLDAIQHIYFIFFQSGLMIYSVLLFTTRCYMQQEAKAMLVNKAKIRFGELTRSSKSRSYFPSDGAWVTLRSEERRRGGPERTNSIRVSSNWIWFDVIWFSGMISVKQSQESLVPDGNFAAREGSSLSKKTMLDCAWVRDWTLSTHRTIQVMAGGIWIIHGRVMSCDVSHRNLTPLDESISFFPFRLELL